MARGFLSGLIWGGVVAVGAAAAVSLWVPMRPSPDAAQALPNATVPAATTPVDTGLPETVTAPRRDDTVVRGEEPSGPVSPQPAPATDGMADTSPAARPEVGGAVAALTSPVVVDARSGTGAQDTGAATGTTGTDAETIAEPGASATAETSISSDPAQPRVPQAQETPADIPTPVGEAPATAPATSPAVAGTTSETDTQKEPVQDPASSQRPRKAGLPQTGTVDAADNAETGAGSETGGAPSGNALTDRAERQPAETPATGSEEPPVSAFAQPYENTQDKPLMAIVLIDDAQSVGVEALAAFPSPITIAVDPALPDASERMARHRAAGFEVLALADLPTDAAAQDAEMAVSAILAQLPEAVGVLEGVKSGIQGNRALSDQVTAILRDRGYGLVTQNNGLNTVPKLSARAGVPTAVVFRDFDGQGQSATVMRRFLDQAAFRAGQMGGVVMLGRVRPETISALLLWGLQDRAARVALVPVSAVLEDAATASQ